ncbi:MAG: TatD family hydrolase [Clostridia bacterium]
MAIDTHCHLNDEQFSDVDEIISNLKTNNITNAIIAGYNIESSVSALEISKKSDILYCAVGFHPENESELKVGDLEKIAEMTKDEKVVAIGEIGLDYHYEPFDKERQKSLFIKQIQLAIALKLPIVIHQRDCGMDVLEIVKKYHDKLVGIVLHCFSESVEMAREFVKLGCYISFAGTLTFKNAKGLLDVAKIVPSELILSETDSPYLAPQAFRGKRNEPKNVNCVVEKLAELREVTIEEMTKQIEKNVHKVFFKIK